MTLELALANLAAWSVQVAVLALAAAAGLKLLPVERPAARLAVAQALLAATLLLPLVQPWRASSAAVFSSIGEATVASPAAGLPGPRAPLPRPAWPAAAALALAAGAAFQLGRLGLGLARLRALARAAAPFQVPSWAEPLRRALAPRVTFVLSPAGPATFGHRRPTVLLPPSFAAMAKDQQRAIVLHELLHVRRGDWRVQLVEELLLAALFFHPALHWLIGRVRLAREQAVDAEVVRRLGSRSAYLDSLLAVARAAAVPRAVPAAPFLRESHLRERVDQLLKEALMSRTRTVLHVAALAAAVLLTVSWTASAVPFQAAGEKAKVVAAEARPATIQLSQDVDAKELKLLQRVNPAYPAAAKAEGVEGVYVLDVVIGKDGRIRDAQVILSAATMERIKQLEPQKGTPAALEADPRLADAAKDAVRQWQYQPVVRKGEAVEVKATVTVRFKLH